MRRISPKILLFTLLTLAALLAVPLSLGEYTDDRILPPMQLPSPQQIEEDMKRIEYVRSHMDEILARLIQNDTFRKLVSGRDWEILKNPYDGKPIVALGLDDYVITVYIHGSKGEVVRDIVMVYPNRTKVVLDTYRGKDIIRIVGIELSLNLEIKEIWDLPLISTPPLIIRP